MSYELYAMSFRLLIFAHDLRLTRLWRGNYTTSSHYWGTNDSRRFKTAGRNRLGD
jgi:hypothetical protein